MSLRVPVLPSNRMPSIRLPSAYRRQSATRKRFHNYPNQKKPRRELGLLHRNSMPLRVPSYKHTPEKRVLSFLQATGNALHCPGCRLLHRNSMPFSSSRSPKLLAIFASPVAKRIKPLILQDRKKQPPQRGGCFFPNTLPRILVHQPEKRVPPSNSSPMSCRIHNLPKAFRQAFDLPLAFFCSDTLSFISVRSEPNRFHSIRRSMYGMCSNMRSCSGVPGSAGGFTRCNIIRFASCCMRCGCGSSGLGT